MSLSASDRELQAIVGALRDDRVVQRDILWEWALSRVERVHLDGGGTLIVKRSREPLIDEGRILRQLAGGGIPLPELFDANVRDGVLTLALEDLGPSTREATLQEAALAAVRTHAARPPDGLDMLDAAALAALPSRALTALDRLERAGRWPESENGRSALTRLQAMAGALSGGADVPPFGLCHSEFHPTSVHVGSKKTGVLDWARAFVGPGLLDLASYAGTVAPPDPAACRALIEAYAAEGGAPPARDARAGLPAERWALFWHRVWVVEWYARSCATWMDDPSQDGVFQETVQRHAEEALSMANGA